MIEELICIIPSDRTALAVGRFLGRVMFVAARERRKVALENLTICFGDSKTSRELNALARANFEHFGMLAIEFYRLRRWTEDELADRLIIRGKKNFDFAWSPGNRGIYYVTGHFGSFEVLAAMSRFLGIRGNLLVTAAPNYFVNKYMMFDRGGSSSGLRILPHRGSVHRILKALNEGEMVVVLADQRGDDTRPVPVDFFGRKVLANGIFARFAIEGNALVFPIRAKRLADGRYQCDFGEEIPIHISGDEQTDLIVNSQRFHNIFESWLRDDPEQGFWLHRKFRRKSRRLAHKSMTTPTNVSHKDFKQSACNQGGHEGF